MINLSVTHSYDLIVYKKNVTFGVRNALRMSGSESMNGGESVHRTTLMFVFDELGLL